MASQLLSAFLPLVVSNRHQESFWVVNNRACSIQGVQKEEYSESYEVTRELSGKTGDTARKSSPRVWTAHPEHEPAPAEEGGVCGWVGVSSSRHSLLNWVPADHFCLPPEKDVPQVRGFQRVLRGHKQDCSQPSLPRINILHFPTPAPWASTTKQQVFSSNMRQLVFF